MNRARKHLIISDYYYKQSGNQETKYKKKMHYSQIFCCNQEKQPFTSVDHEVAEMSKEDMLAFILINLSKGRFLSLKKTLRILQISLYCLLYLTLESLKPDFTL